MKTTIFFRSFFCILLVLLFAACDEEKKKSSSSTTGGGGGTPVDGVPVGQVEATGFWINAADPEFPTYVYQSTGFSDDCFIDSTETGNLDLTCFIDILEGDFYMHDLPIQYNIPPGLCEHISITPAWHWNYSSGFGPSSYTIELDSSGEPFIDDIDGSGDNGCQSTLADTSVVNCDVNPEILGFSETNRPNCAYDYTAIGGPNCCFGEYTYIIQEDLDSNGSIDKVETGQGDWGGDVKSCIGGPVRTSWEAFTKDGYPASVALVVPGLESATPGLNQEVKILANIASVNTNFSYAASFYTSTGSPHSHDGYETATTSILPYAVQPLDDLDGSTMVSGTDAFRFTCLDGGFEVIHRISVYVREWNTIADFIAYETSDGATYDPDVVGAEGTDCDYSGLFGDGCNDFFDFDDIITNVGAYTTDNTALTPALTRRTYFPNVDYDE